MVKYSTGSSAQLQAEKTDDFVLHMQTSVSFVCKQSVFSGGGEEEYVSPL